MRVAICLSMLLVLALSQQWFMPDSNLINQDEFHSKVQSDRSTFKIVKFFSQNCIYCRYLKQVIDGLKHEKQWCFEIYDFNCGWYPNFCYQNVHAGSFPYTAIYDGEGKEYETIMGFYPEPVMRTIFDRSEQSCLKYKQTLKSVGQQQQPASSLTTHEEMAQPNVVVVQQTEVVVEPKQQVTQQQQIPKQQIKQQQIRKSAADVTETTVAEPRSIFSYVFYAACSLVGGYYVYHIHTSGQTQAKSSAVSHSKEEVVSAQTAASGSKSEQNELLAELPDDQL